MLRISWKDRVTNDEVYRRMGTGKALLGDIVRRHLSFLGHVLRKDELEKLVVIGFVDGKRARGRQRETLFTYQIETEIADGTVTVGRISGRAICRGSYWHEKHR